MVVVDEASMISCTFYVMAATFSQLNVRPVVVIAGDKCQQQHLQTVASHTSATTSIINDHRFNAVNAVHHTLYQQFASSERPGSPHSIGAKQNHHPAFTSRPACLCLCRHRNSRRRSCHLLPIHTGIRANHYEVTGPEHKTSCALAG